jgi:hypothetical protein
VNFTISGNIVGWNLPRNSNLTTKPPGRAKENKMNEEAMLNTEQEATDTCRPVERARVRKTSDVIYELSYERKGVSESLVRLNKAIEANPEAVSEHHKELWRKQAKAMQEYVDVLGERIKDLIDNG